jgi:hypothetical protein
MPFQPGNYTAYDAQIQPFIGRFLSVFTTFLPIANVEERIAAAKSTSPCSRSSHSGQVATYFPARWISTSKSSFKA